MKIMSWNVNGIRASIKKGFLDFLHTEQPEMLFLQEIKAQVDQLGAEVLEHEHYKTYWNPAERKGYSGTALFSKVDVQNVTMGTGVSQFDAEGRVVSAEVGDFIIYGIYFPNGGSGPERLAYKLTFYDHMFMEFEKKRAEGKKVIITGDFNVAHMPIDLARPTQNVNTSGFLDIERAWFNKLMDAGYVDTYRHFYPEEKDQYSWWDQRFQSRTRNVGWRIDYFVVSKEALPHVKAAGIRQDILGSDHCPVWIDLEV